MGTGPSREARINRFCEYNGIDSEEELQEYYQKCRELKNCSDLQSSAVDYQSSGTDPKIMVSTVRKNPTNAHMSTLRALRVEHIRRGHNLDWGGDDGTGFSVVVKHQDNKRKRTKVQIVETPLTEEQRRARQDLRNPDKWDDDQATLNGARFC